MSYSATVDVLVIAPFYIELGVNSCAAQGLVVFRVIRLVRLARVMKLSKNSIGLAAITETFTTSTEALSLLV